VAIARVPGSTSNLGPGFDVLGLALSIFTEVEIQPASHLMIETAGEGVERARDASHLAARVATEVAGTDRLFIRVRSDVPLGRGLGSSAALAAATAAAAGAEDPLAIAARFDGHAENAAASVLGGLVAATFVDGEVVARKLPLDPELCFVALVPERQLATTTARVVLPTSLPFADAVFNLGRLGLLLAGLADRQALVSAAGEDRLHQDVRSSLYPEAPVLLEALRAAGATISCWSGAGPGLLGICTDEATAEKVALGARAALGEVGLTGRAIVLSPDLAGLTVEDS
jgi:homoserine kinase